jgi:methyl coenzyme M reductase alpha subunit
MKRYLNLSGDSGVVAYELRPNAVEVKFRGSDRVYVYSHASAGATHVARMKRLAEKGKGLSTYISRHVHDRYQQ